MMRNNFKGTISAFFTSTTCDTMIPPPDTLAKLLKNDMFTVLLVCSFSNNQEDSYKAMPPP